MNSMRSILLLPLCTAAIAGSGDPADDLVPTFYEPAVVASFDVSSEWVIAEADYCDPVLNDPCVAREISFIIRYPTDTERGDTVGPQPVVVLSHGGSGENFGPDGPMAQWGHWLAEAGYAAVSVAHPARTSDELALCMALNVPDGTMGCAEYGTINWDRPQDIRRVLLALGDLATGAPWDQRLDLDHLAVLGYSGGAAGAMSAAGVDRVLKYAPDGAPLVPDVSSPGVDAMVALSPSRAGRIGFFDTTRDQDTHSWQDLAVPTLTMTGEGDNTCQAQRSFCIAGDTPTLRKLVIEQFPEGLAAHMLYIDDIHANHVLFGGNLGSCHADASDPVTECDRIIDQALSGVLAFLDWNLRDHQPAYLWMENQTIEDLTGGDGQWTRHTPGLLLRDGFED